MKNDDQPKLISDDDSLPKRLVQTAVMLIVGTIVYGLYVSPAMEPILRGHWLGLVLDLTMKVLITYWCVTLVFIWWKPPWGRREYLKAEKKLMFLILLSQLVFVILSFFTIAIIVVWLFLFVVLGLPLDSPK